jgi:hypothetical protein
MTWEQAEAAAQQVGSGGNEVFVKLKDDKDSVRGVFVGDPVVVQKVWTGKGFEIYNAAKHKDDTPKTEFRFNFYIPGQGYKIIAGGARWFASVKVMRDKYGLDKKVFEVTRQGKAGDTNTTYMFLPDSDIDDALRAEMAKATPHSLEPKASGASGAVPF